MAVIYNPRIVTDGLTFCLDAASPRSYPGVGTTAIDLCGNTTDLTLVNGVQYSNEGNGSFLFDGTNDFIVGTGTTNLFDPSVGFTISFWINQVTEDRTVGVLRQEDSAGVRSFYVITRPEPAGYMAIQTFTSSATLGFTCEGGPGTAWPLDEWYHCTFVYRGGTSNSDLEWYFNGVETLDFGWNYRFRTYTNTPDVDTDGERKFGDSEARGRYLNAYLANLQTYNRTLTDEEIKQNYNATKGRFGL